MEKRKLPTERRFAVIGVNELNFKNEDLRRMHYAFRHLDVLSKTTSVARTREREKDFYNDKEFYQEKMKWVNDFMKSKGYTEDVFRDMDDYKTSSDDYDYYYELKTPEELIEEEQARKEEEARTKA